MKIVTCYIFFFFGGGGGGLVGGGGGVKGEGAWGIFDYLLCFVFI